MINKSYANFYGWSLDFWRAFLEKPKWRRWLCKKFMGRYAWNELIGMKQAVEKEYEADFVFEIDYGCENQDYHKRFDRYKDW